MEFKFSYHLTEQDFFEFNLFHNLASKNGKKSIKRFRIMISILILAFGLLRCLVDGFDSTSLTTLLVLVCYGVVAFCAFKPFVRFVVKQQLKAMKKQGKLPYSSDATMTFTDLCFTEMTATNKSEYSYSVICDFYLINDRMIYLYISAAQGFLLPVSAFESKAQLDAFLEFVGQKTLPVTVCDFERSPYMEPVFSENAHK